MLLGSIAALTIGLISGPSAAQAATSGYCTGWLSPGTCEGAARWLYQTYGWGDQGAVCVAVNSGYPTVCSSGAGAGVDSPRLGSAQWLKPLIINWAGKQNFVHGIALQP
jgi:hypothetical protein